MGTPAATIVGGLGSGGLALKISWKAPFIALGGLFAIISVLAWVFIPNVPEPEVTLQRSELRINTDRNAPQIVMLGATKRITAILQFDWPGLALLIIGVLLFTVSLTIGPEGPEPWKTPTVILLLTLGLLFLGCFIVWQNVSKRPMIPPSIWNNWSVTLVCPFLYPIYGQLLTTLDRHLHFGSVNGILLAIILGVDVHATTCKS